MCFVELSAIQTSPSFENDNKWPAKQQSHRFKTLPTPAASQTFDYSMDCRQRDSSPRFNSQL